MRGPGSSSPSGQILSWVEQSLSPQNTHSPAALEHLSFRLFWRKTLHLGDRVVVLGMEVITVSTEENQASTVHRHGATDIHSHLALMWVVGVRQIDSRLYLFPCRAFLTRSYSTLYF